MANLQSFPLDEREPGRRLRPDRLAMGLAALLVLAGLLAGAARVLDGGRAEDAPRATAAPVETLTAKPAKHTYYVVGSEPQRQALVARLAEHQLVRGEFGVVTETFEVIVIAPDAPLSAWQAVFDAQANLYQQGASSAVVDMR